MIRLIVAIIVLLLVALGDVWSTPPAVEHPLDVENPSCYHELVNASPIPGLFTGCTLVETGNPKYWKGRPERVFFKQVYVTPAEYSVFGVHYRLQVNIEIDHDTLSGFAKLEARWAGYKESISNFEKYPAVCRFLEVIDPSEMNFNGTQFYCDMFSKNQISFNLDSGSFYFLILQQPELIQSVSLFLPMLDSMDWFYEFREEVGIGRVLLENGKVTISQDQMCPTCKNRVTFLYSNSRLVSFALSGNQEWEAFPMVAYVKQVVQKRLKGDTLGSCMVGP